MTPDDSCRAGSGRNEGRSAARVSRADNLKMRCARLLCRLSGFEQDVVLYGRTTRVRIPASANSPGIGSDLLSCDTTCEPHVLIFRGAAGYEHTKCQSPDKAHASPPKPGFIQAQPLGACKTALVSGPTLDAGFDWQPFVSQSTRGGGGSMERAARQASALASVDERLLQRQVRAMFAPMATGFRAQTCNGTLAPWAKPSMCARR